MTPLNQLPKADWQQRCAPYAGVLAEYEAQPLCAVISCRHPRYADQAMRAVHQVFGRTLLCKDLKTAHEVMDRTDRKFDCVTIDGDRLARSGTLSGGYRDTRRGYARLASQQRIVDLEQQDYELVQREKQLNQQENKLMQAVEQQRAQLRHAQQQCGAAQDQLSDAGQQVDQARSAWKAKQLLHQQARQHADEKLQQAKGLEKQLEVWRQPQLSASQQTKHEQQLQTGVLQHETAAKALQADLAKQQQHIQGLEARLQTFLRPRHQQLQRQLAAAAAPVDAGRVRALQEDAARSAQQLANLAKAQTEAKKQRDQAQKQLEKQQAAAGELQEKAQTVAQELDRTTAELEAESRRLDEHNKQFQSLSCPTWDQLPALQKKPKADLGAQLAKLVKKAKGFGAVNQKAKEEYAHFAKERTGLLERRRMAEEEEECLEELLAKLDGQKEAAIERTFEQVNKHFGKVFAALKPGGRAKLVKVKPQGELEGIAVSASFRSKGQNDNFEYIGSMSGGQKTLVALALIFGIQRADPAPFYLFDEIDAALDAEYRDRVARLVAQEAKETQIVATTFRPELVKTGGKFFKVSLKERSSRVQEVAQEAALEVVTTNGRNRPRT